MSSHVRQRKSPYFYVRKGAGFVLLDNHEETSTRYKTEAEAKKAVLALNDAWRAKHAPRANPGPMMYSIMRAQEEARKKAKRNPRHALTPVAHGSTRRMFKPKPITEARIGKAVERASVQFWASMENAYPKAWPLEPSDNIHERSLAYMTREVRKWVREHTTARGLPTRRNGGDANLRRAVERASVKFWVSIEQSLPEVTENMNRTPFGYASDAEVDAFNDGMLAVVKEWLAETPDVLTNPRRRNPKDDQFSARADVLHLFSTATVGEGRELEAFAKKLGKGTPLTASDIESAVTAAEARLEDAEYEVETNRIAEYRAGLREERDHYRQLLAAIKVLKPSRRRNPAASGEVELILWARPKGQTDALYEQPIYTVGRTMEDIERVKKLAAKDGWHTFRVQRIDLSKPYNPQQEFAATVRGSRRRNPRKYAEGSMGVSSGHGVPVKDVRKGQLVKRKPDAKKFYQVEGYDRSERKYVLQDWDDISRAVYVKGDTLVYFGD